MLNVEPADFTLYDSQHTLDLPSLRYFYVPHPLVRNRHHSLLHTVGILGDDV
jgi:hypothetical protein